ncbi:MAG: hypothetical protein K9M99_02635 [Candidatus Cloacimonetes bacterium]|nr:hypothetical protein [Candidatus Cloacimonadota bacterium]
MQKIVILLILGLLLMSCTDDSDSGVLFSLDVVDSAGNPVSGLLVDVNNAVFNGPWGGRPETTISFEVGEESQIKLEIFDLQNELVRTLIDDTLDAGQHNVCWNGHNNVDEPANFGGTNIFRYQMTAIKTTSGEILYQESKYMCMELLLYSYLSQVGSTDEAGSFNLENMLAFPHLFNLGEQEKYDEDGNYCGKFTLSDSINIKLTDPETEEYMVATVLMGSSKHNHYSFVWENLQTGCQAEETEEIANQAVIIDRGIGDDEVPTGFFLWGNYPNPFN